MKITITGDWAPKQRQVESLAFHGLVIANLEGPILESRESHIPAPKAGPTLAHHSLPNSSAEYVLTLANNHVMDYGEPGLRETLKFLKQRGYKYVGAGLDARSAATPLMLDHDGARIGILSRCEVQFGIATSDTPGVASFDATVYRAVRDLKRETDVVIASIHAAAEMFHLPSPRRQDAWRALIDAGADVVHGHHSHVPQGWEIYEGGLIFYGLGNLCVDPATWSRYPNALWTLAPELSWSSGKLEMRLATAVIEDLGERVRIRDADTNEARLHKRYLDECNAPLANRPLLEALWQDVSVRMYQAYYADWLSFESRKAAPSASWRQHARGIVRHARSLLRRSGKEHIQRAVSQGQYLLWYHLFACDSHNDAITTALGVLGGALEDRRTAETARLVDEMMPGPY